MDYYTKKQFEESSKGDEPSTSASLAVKDEETDEDEAENVISISSISEKEISSLIDVKSEEVVEDAANG